MKMAPGIEWLIWKCSSAFGRTRSSKTPACSIGSPVAEMFAFHTSPPVGRVTRNHGCSSSGWRWSVPCDSTPMWTSAWLFSTANARVSVERVERVSGAKDKSSGKKAAMVE